MNLIDFLSISIECDGCGRVDDAPHYTNAGQAATDFAAAGWILREGDEVNCPACAKEEREE